MPDAFLCDDVRTPIGRYGGALAPVRPDDLGALLLAMRLARNPGRDPAAVDEVWMGCANQAGEPPRRAIALGHPRGMWGARSAGSAALELRKTGGRYAIATMCIGVGQGAAILMERV